MRLAFFSFRYYALMTLFSAEGKMYLPLIIGLIRTALSDVIVERVSNFKPIRIYEDLPAR